ncbi:DUF1492 domain-containing protein [Streptococcus suis]|uniref:DUF1492 domain-containing protein n=1 Tax=Streptococcus suis TaxID=1307 RepID=UPI00200153E1|nr:DUF1492 domain-containing protein [Streptococcus suis]
MCKQLAKRKLKEFPRWCRVAVLHHDQIQIGDDWTVKLFEFDPEDYKGKVHGWQREAPNEVNTIAKPRHQAILIMSYILPEKIRSAKQQAQRLGIAESTYYLAKNEALKEFAGQYRDGSLLQHLDS